MSDETRAQIRKDAKKYWESIGGKEEDPNGYHEDSFISGSHNQHAIAYAQGHSDGHLMGYKAGEKEGWNASLEEFKKRLIPEPGMPLVWLQKLLIQELEALKK